jgi:flagellar assembly protein FliH
MSKHRQADIHSFEFADLQGDHVVSGSSKQFQAFSFKSLEGKAVESQVSDEEVRKERTFEKQNNFRIDDQVRQLRGLSRQEETDFQKMINEEVERRLKMSQEDAYKEGLELGRKEGKEQALAEFSESLSQKVEDLALQLGEIHLQTEKIYAKNRTELQEFIKRFTKWIVMKEINDDVYLEKLLEKLILELNCRKNLIVKVGRANFSQMPEVVKIVEARLGQLQNVRIEIVPQVAHPGIILESESALIDGSLEGVFKSIDKIFDQVMNNGS